MANDVKDLSLREIEALVTDMQPGDVLRATEHLSGMERLNAILSAKRARRAVQAMPLADLYFLVRDIGKEDATTAIELASHEQVEGLLDLEIWEKDRLDVVRAREWFELLMELDDRLFLSQYKALDRALVLAFFIRHVRVFKQDETFDPIESQRMIFATPDDRYYIERLRTHEETRVVEEIILRLYRLDVEEFYFTVEGIYFELESTTEEMAYQEKVRRLKDHGFPEYFEALDVLQTLTPESVRLRERSVPVISVLDRDVAAPIYPVLVGERDSLLDRAMTLLDPGQIAEVRWDMAYVVNRYLVAKRVDTGDVKEVKNAIGHVHGLMNLGLETTVGGDAAAAADTLQDYYVRELFLLGRALVQDLKKRMTALSKRLAKTFGSGALLFESPYQEFCFDLEKDEPRLYLGVLDRADNKSRPIETSRDRTAADHLLTRLELLSDVFERLLPDGKFRADLKRTNLPDPADLRLSGLFVAGMAFYALDGAFTPGPFPAGRLGEFVERAIRQEKKGWAFDGDLVGAFADSLEELGAHLGEDPVTRVRPLFEEFLQAAADELGPLHAAGTLSTPYIRSILLRL